MKPLAVITHVDQTDIGLIDEIGRARGHDIVLARPYRGERLPEPSDIGAVVALGGPQAAYEDHLYLRDEEHFLARAVEVGIPVLAVCLGAQLLARALGGSAQPGDSGLEAGLIRVQSTEAGPFVISGQFFSFHFDSLTPPENARILAASDRYVQAWTTGSALAVQFHPEITLAGVNRWLDVAGSKLKRNGVDLAKMRRDAEQYFAAGATGARRFLTAWFDRLEEARYADN